MPLVGACTGVDGSGTKEGLLLSSGSVGLSDKGMRGRMKWKGRRNAADHDMRELQDSMDRKGKERARVGDSIANGKSEVKR